MTPFVALAYSFLFGLLHGVLPDEHTWPITFSYAIGGASGREGLKAGLYFSAAFTVQRTLLSELAYLALSPFLLKPIVNEIVYCAVGIAMSAAGIVVVRRNRYPHLHVVRHRHSAADEAAPSAPPVRWTLVHGFMAGFGFGAFSLFVNTVAAPAMPGPWLGFLPGLLFGLGTMIMVAALGMIFGASLHWIFRSLTPAEVRMIGAMTGARTLFYGGLLFLAFGMATFFGLARNLPFDLGYVVITAFMIAVAIPSFLYTVREIRQGSIGKEPGADERQ